MKYCKNCNRTFDNSASFCPACGSALEMEQEKAKYAQDSSGSASNSGMPNNSGFFATLKEYFSSHAVEWDASDNLFFRYLPALMSILGLIIAWNIASIVGGVLAICGIGFGIYSNNKLNKTVALVFGIITVILVILFGL